MTGAVECLARQHGDKFVIGTQTTCQGIWQNNPHLVPLNPEDADEIIDCTHKAINRCGQTPVHFLEAFTEDIGEKLGVQIKCLVNRPYLYLSDDEKEDAPPFPKPYALVNAGFKNDYPAKWAGTKNYQEIVDATKNQLTWVQIGENHHHHPKLNDVVDWVGRTDFSPRELFKLVYHSVLGVGGITFLHHVYAAFEKPFICYAGGREPLSWLTYPTATVLHTLGQLDCCKSRGCWKARITPKDERDGSVCTLPMASGEDTVAGCMALLGSSPAIEAIRRILAYRH